MKYRKKDEEWQKKKRKICLGTQRERHQEND
jgi:hypothetical protein